MLLSYNNNQNELKIPALSTIHQQEENMQKTKFDKIKINSALKPELSKNSLTVLEKRYLMRNEKGDIIESPEDLFKRVARFIASADFLYNASDDEVNKTASNFYENMVSFKFLPKVSSIRFSNSC